MSTAGSTGSTASVCDVRHSGPNFRGLSMPIAFRLLAAAAVVGCASLVLLFSSDVSCLSSTSATTDTYVGRGEPGPPAREEGPAPALEDVGTRSTGVEARSPSADDVIRTIERSKPAELTIVCRDASGRSVAGCSVQATESHGGRTRQTVLTDSEGRTRLPVPPELESLVLSAEDARAGTSGELEVWLASSVRSELELVLRPPRTLRGVVLSEERNPVVGALVHAKLKGRMLGGSTPSVREEVRTDSSGRFSFTLDAVPCLLVVSATKDDGAVTSKDVHWPRDSEDTVSLVFEGEPELQVRGTVRNVAGGVCPGVQVVLSPQEPARGSRTVLSDVSGRFNFQLSEPGVFDLAARGAGYLTLEPVHMEVTLSQQQVQVELLVTESAMISGRVSKPSGEPWGGVQVGAFATSAPEAGAWLLEHRFQAVRVSEPTQTSADGSFEVRDLHPGSLYEVWCLPDPARPQCFVYEEGSRLESRTWFSSWTRLAFEVESFERSGRSRMGNDARWRQACLSTSARRAESGPAVDVHRQKFTRAISASKGSASGMNTMPNCKSSEQHVCCTDRGRPRTSRKTPSSCAAKMASSRAPFATPTELRQRTGSSTWPRNHPGPLLRSRSGRMDPTAQCASFLWRPVVTA